MKKKIDVAFFSRVMMPSWIEKHKETIYFIGTKADIEKNNYEKNIYQLKDGTVRQLTRFNDVGSYHCGQNGLKFVKRVKTEDKWCVKSAIYELSYDGGEAMIQYELPYAISDIKWINEENFFFVAQKNLKFERYVASGLSEKEASLKIEKENKECREFVEVPFWTNGGGDISEMRSVLYLYAKGQITKISDTDGNSQMACLSKDKQTIYYTKRKITDGLADSWNGLYSYHVDTKKTQAHPLFEKHVSYRLLNCINEHELLLGVGLSETYGDNENTQLFKWHVDENKLEKVYAGDPYSLGNSVGSDIKMGNRSSCPIFDDDGFYMIATDEEHAPLLKIGYEGKIEAVTKGLEMIQEVIADGDDFIVIAMIDNHANEIYRLDRQGHMSALTSLNTALEEEYQYYQPQTITFTNENEIEIKGWVMLPENLKGNEKCPAILDIHGGPKTVYGPHFFHEMQWFVANGYAVMFTNPTGSDGRGNKFSDIRGCYGTVDYRDLMTFVDVVLDAYPCIDQERLGVTGGSYGGFMTNWMIGHTHRFKAAVSQRSIASWLIFENTSDIGYTFGVDQMQGNQWQQLELLWNQSPIQFAPQVKTPTLFIHSDEDTRCWMAEGISMFTALKRHGVDSKLCLFRGENHELSRSGKPQNRIRRLEELLGWMNHYLK